MVGRWALVGWGLGPFVAQPFLFVWGLMMAKKKSKELLHLQQKADGLTLLPTGSTLLNLAISQDPNGGWPMGSFAWVVGQSGSGKTFLALTCLAEACQRKAFDNHQLIFDCPENGALMDMRRFFGDRMADRVCSPSATLTASYTIEEFYTHVTDAVTSGPTIYVLDSMDALSSDYDISKAEETAKVVRGESTKAKGDYGDGKAKKNSRNLRRVVGLCERNNSLLIIISQTRDNINDMFKPETVSGGRSLEYYASTQVWCRKGTEIKRTYRDKDYELGVRCNIKVAKNRVDGNRRKVSMPIYNTYGIDNTGSLIDWLLLNKYWTASGQTIDAPELGLSGKRSQLIRDIEDSPALLADLEDLVGMYWQEIEEHIAQNRKARYV